MCIDIAVTDIEVSVPGGLLRGEDTGSGDPVVLLHAGVTDRRVWDPTAARLRDAGYRVIRWDTRGYGQSPPSGGPYSLVADALAVLDARGVDSAHFVGLSQGAATSVDAAIAAPGRVRTLTLVAPGLSGWEWPRLPGYERRAAAAECGDGPGLATEIARLWAPMSFDGGATGDAASQVIVDQVDTFLAEEEFEQDEPDARPHAASITAPALVVLGDRDLDVITEIGTRLATWIPGARLVTLTGADHLLPLRVPDALHAELLAHLRT